MCFDSLSEIGLCFTESTPSEVNDIFLKIIKIMSCYSPENSFQVPEVVYTKHLTNDSSSSGNVFTISETIEAFVSSDQLSEFTVLATKDELFPILHKSCEFRCDIDDIGIRHFYHHCGNYQYLLKSFDISEFIQNMKVLPSKDQSFEQIDRIASYVSENRVELGDSWSLAIHQDYFCISNECNNSSCPSKIFYFMFQFFEEEKKSHIRFQAP